MSKIKVKVIYGDEPFEYAEEHSFLGAERKVTRGELDGEIHVYELDTREDVEVLLQALYDASGWGAYCTNVKC